MKQDTPVFTEDFAFGAAVSAYQTEGACNIDGKGPSIWDTFTARRRNIKGGHNGSVACEFYHRYEKDLQLLKQAGLDNFRFSICWPRIFPQGTGAANSKGVDFYNRLIDKCLELGITPWATLYHWDLPQALQDKGGWVNRDIVNQFADYAALCAEKFADRVPYWMALNEPLTFTGLGYFMGMHAPGKKGLVNFSAAAHHAALCQSAGAKAVKSTAPLVQVGTTLSFICIEPYRPGKDDMAAVRMDVLFNRLFLEPLLGLGYPVKDLPVLERLYDHFLPGDEERLKADLDFLGVQYYTREVVRRAWFTPFIKARPVPATKRGVPVSTMGWEIYPEGLYNVLKKLHKYPGLPPIVITENGIACNDKVDNGRVKDSARIKFLQQHLEQVARAKNEGVDVRGYFAWSLLDNFEWAEGYGPRMGLVHVDYDTQQRTLKDSALWLKKFTKAAVGVNE